MIDRHAHRDLAVFAGRTERHDISILISAGLAFFSDGVPFGQPPQDRRLVYPDVVSLQKNDELAKPAAKRDLGRGRNILKNAALRPGQLPENVEQFLSISPRLVIELGLDHTRQIV